MAFLFVLLFIFSIFGKVYVHPSTETDEHLYKEEHCIKMNSKAEREIQAIVQKIGELLTDLMQQHHDFDIRLVRLDIEKHSDSETEEKDTVLQLVINDCATLDEEEVKETVEDESSSQVTPQVTPEVINLTFEEPGLQFLKLIEQKNPGKPIFVYVQKDGGNTDYAIVNKK